MASGMKDFTPEARRCNTIKNLETGNIYRREECGTFEEWYNLVAFAMMHTLEFSISMDEVPAGEYANPDVIQFTESEMKAMAVPRLGKLAAQLDISAGDTWTKNDFIKAILEHYAQVTA